MSRTVLGALVGCAALGGSAEVRVGLDPGRAAALLVSGDGRVVARYPGAATGAR